jgi:hypothetical protein
MHVAVRQFPFDTSPLVGTASSPESKLPKHVQSIVIESTARRQEGQLVDQMEEKCSGLVDED